MKFDPITEAKHEEETDASFMKLLARAGACLSLIEGEFDHEKNDAIIKAFEVIWDEGAKRVGATEIYRLINSTTRELGYTPK